jgi:hypothetical protein
VKMGVFIDVHAKNATMAACIAQSHDTPVFCSLSRYMESMFKPWWLNPHPFTYTFEDIPDSDQKERHVDIVNAVNRHSQWTLLRKDLLIHRAKGL